MVGCRLIDLYQPRLAACWLLATHCCVVPTESPLTAGPYFYCDETLTAVPSAGPREDDAAEEWTLQSLQLLDYVHVPILVLLTGYDEGREK